jgi:xanthosine utilization system XapX-like protein
MSKIRKNKKASKIAQSRPSSGGVSSGSSVARTSSGGRSKASAGSTFILLLIVIIVVAMYALLQVDLPILIVLFVLSVIGVLVGKATSKLELTPEDELRKSTIEQYQVPETRGALLKFAIEAAQQIHPVSPLAAKFSLDAKRQIWLNEIWANKCRKVHTTARLAMKDDAKSLSEITKLITDAGVKV